MCGIAGIVRADPRGVDLSTLGRMAAAIRHRGPDGYGFYSAAQVGLAHVRLSIIDRAGGAQPMEDAGGPVLVYNGEVYNYRELRAELQALGHAFHTTSDTEVLLRAWQAWGPGMLERLNGQFAFALWDRAEETLFLARDRFGVRPLYYAEPGDDLVFGSEAKAIFASGEVAAAPDPVGLDQVFTFWAPQAPRTVFAGVRQLPPGHCALWRAGRLQVRPWYRLDYPSARMEPAEAVAALDDLLTSSVAFRLRADVPVGAYLSGGLDSSITCRLAAAQSPHQLRTFSITFADPALDESRFQQEVARAVGSRHVVEHMGPGAIAGAFPEVVRHAEVPLTRTAPVPMYLLARRVREQGITVVLTGEGSDELFLGYDLFKEAAVRRFCLRQPHSAVRPRLFDRLYPYLRGGAATGEFWRRFFLDAGSPADPLFSHLPRFLLTGRIRDFYSAELRAQLAGHDPLAELRAGLPAEFGAWAPDNQAAYLEMRTLLDPYLLSAQGDRMSMAHGVEGRYPFLDHRLFEFAARLPVRSRLRGLHEKDILRRWAASRLPASVTARPKQPYRAPDAPAFFGAEAPGYVRELLSPAALMATGWFAPAAVAGLVRRCAAGQASGTRENQALVAILSTQLWHQAFVAGAGAVRPLPPGGADVVLLDPVPVTR